MSRQTPARDFRSIDARSATVIPIEADRAFYRCFPRVHGRLNGSFSLGVQTRPSCAVTSIDSKGVQMGSERIESATVLWPPVCARVPMGREAGLSVDAQGRGFANLISV
jgi:hypothetical protein